MAGTSATTRYWRWYTRRACGVCIKLGFAELDIAGLDIILTDAAVVYKAEAFYGDRLRVALAVDEFSRYGCDILLLS